MVNIANSISNNEYSFIKKSYDRACGVCHNDKNKSRILDFDEAVDINNKIMNKQNIKKRKKEKKKDYYQLKIR
jgi:hypothetical protein